MTEKCFTGDGKDAAGVLYKVGCLVVPVCVECGKEYMDRQAAELFTDSFVDMYEKDYETRGR